MLFAIKAKSSRIFISALSLTAQKNILPLITLISKNNYNNKILLKNQLTNQFPF